MNRLNNRDTFESPSHIRARRTSPTCADQTPPPIPKAGDGHWDKTRHERWGNPGVPHSVPSHIAEVSLILPERATSSNLSSIWKTFEQDEDQLDR